jgi:hypothetical protein
MTTTMCHKPAYLGLFAVGSLVLAACGASAEVTTRGVTATGVATGRVTASPTCPVERIGHPCPPRPVVADVQARAAGRVVASTRSHADGTYRLELAGGTYTVGAVTQNMLPRCVAQTVTVTPNQTTRAAISCDTGIR